MASIPFLFRKQLFQVGLGLSRALAICQPPALGKTVDMGVHGKCGHTEGLSQHYGGRLVPNPGQRLQIGIARRNFPGKAPDQLLGHSEYVSGFIVRQSTAGDNVSDLLFGQLYHFFGSGCPGKQAGSNFVHAGVGALGGQDGGNQKRIGIAMPERYLNIGIQ